MSWPGHQGPSRPRTPQGRSFGPQGSWQVPTDSLASLHLPALLDHLDRGWKWHTSGTSADQRLVSMCGNTTKQGIVPLMYPSYSGWYFSFWSKGIFMWSATFCHSWGAGCCSRLANSTANCRLKIRKISPFWINLFSDIFYDSKLIKANVDISTLILPPYLCTRSRWYRNNTHQVA
jgi:hypothetical protein